jgi:hypothetical protein
MCSARSRRRVLERGDVLGILHLDFRWEWVVTFSIWAFELQIVPLYPSFRKLMTATVNQQGQKIKKKSVPPGNQITNIYSGVAEKYCAFRKHCIGFGNCLESK